MYSVKNTSVINSSVQNTWTSKSSTEINSETNNIIINTVLTKNFEYGRRKCFFTEKFLRAWEGLLKTAENEVMIGFVKIFSSKEHNHNLNSANHFNRSYCFIDNSTPSSGK